MSPNDETAVTRTERTPDTIIRVGGQSMTIREALSMNRKDRRRLGIRGAQGLQVPFNYDVETWDAYKKRTAPPEPVDAAALMKKDAEAITT